MFWFLVNFCFIFMSVYYIIIWLLFILSKQLRTSREGCWHDQYSIEGRYYDQHCQVLIFTVGTDIQNLGLKNIPWISDTAERDKCYALLMNASQPFFSDFFNTANHIQIILPSFIWFLLCTPICQALWPTFIFSILLSKFFKTILSVWLFSCLCLLFLTYVYPCFFLQFAVSDNSLDIFTQIFHFKHTVSYSS